MKERSQPKGSNFNTLGAVEGTSPITTLARDQGQTVISSPRMSNKTKTIKAFHALQLLQPPPHTLLCQMQVYRVPSCYPSFKQHCHLASLSGNFGEESGEWSVLSSSLPSLSCCPPDDLSSLMHVPFPSYGVPFIILLFYLLTSTGIASLVIK